MAPSTNQKFKVKLASGRVLGPIDLVRIALLIKKKKITGVELARELPNGEWMNINQVSPIADLLVAYAERSSDDDRTAVIPPPPPPNFAVPGTTRVLERKSPTGVVPSPQASTGNARNEEDEKTVVAPFGVESERKESSLSGNGGSENTAVQDVQRSISPEHPVSNEGTKLTASISASSISTEQTLMLAAPAGKNFWGFRDALDDPRKFAGAMANYVRRGRKSITGGLVTFAVGYIIYTLLSAGDPSSSSDVKWIPIRPTLPSLNSSQKDPAKSAKLFNDAMKYYLLDTVPGYKVAAEFLALSAKYDSSNVKALALLASSYLNLIDSSNKDENFFDVISKLIELSRAKDVDLPETVIADVEFYITINKAEAAQSRIVEYTKTQTNFGLEMFYYLALAFYHRGDAQSAVRYISQYPENRAFSPKLFYLRGRIAEKLGDTTAAIQEYEKAIRMTPAHAKSRLAIANIQSNANQLQNAAMHLEYIVRNPRLLAPKDLARAYYLHSLLSQLYKKDEVALLDMERAVKLERENHEYLLEYYTLLAKSGDSLSKLQPAARMYYFLGEGEKFLKDGHYHDALTQFLQARQANNNSPLPLVKIGDMFLRMNDLSNAKINYKMAADRARENIDVWSKYIDVLIQSYEWEEAKVAMDKFRRLPVPQSAIDKAAADMYAKQGLFQEAQVFYRKAMARETIDSGVYIAYAKSLMETKNFKQAPFFFALALRFDPLNVEALVGTAKCIAATESIDRAITMLQDELQKGSAARSELLAAIADLYTQKGSWEEAQQFVSQATAANPDYAYPWKVQAKIDMNRENTDKTALDNALDAYGSYSDRNTSDPSGYLERYRIFVKKGDFERASEELGKIFAIYPKYPNLHFYKGALYSIMGNAKLAIEEYRVELNNNPNSVATLIALGKEYVKAGGVPDAITLFNKAMQLAPRLAEPKVESAYGNYLLKNYAGAVALYNAALQLDQGNPMVYKRLGLAYRDMGDARHAVQAFQKYLEMEPDAPDKADFQNYR